MQKLFLLIILLFINKLYAQDYIEYNEDITKIINGKWKGKEQRVVEWNRGVSNRIEEPLELDIKIAPGSDIIAIKRHFRFKLDGEETEMITENIGMSNQCFYFRTFDEKIMSDNKYTTYYPGSMETMPHYLFEEGFIIFQLQGDKLYLRGRQQIIERNEYDTNWRVSDSGAGRHFRKKDFHGNIIILKGLQPHYLPGGFLYEKPAYPLYSEEPFNRTMAEYEWLAEKKLTKKEVKLLTLFCLDDHQISPENVIASATSKADKKTINVKNENIEIFVFDNASEDGDLISVYINGELIKKNVEVKKNGEKIDVKLNKGKNKITIHAENEGRIPPNTAGLTFSDGVNKQTIILQNKKNKRKTLTVVVD